MPDSDSPRGWGLTRQSADVLRVLRPSDGSLVGELAVTHPGEIIGKVARARAAQVGWASLSPEDRGRRLARLLAAMGNRAREIEDTVVAETGKPRSEAIHEIIGALDLLRYYLKSSPGVLRPRRVSPGWILWKRALVLREPLGVIGVISPWNYPFLLSSIPTLTALFGGNAVILKPSEYTPYSGILVEDLARDAGLPEGLVQVIVGDGSTGDALVRSGVDKVIFTGSPWNGRRVLEAASETLTPVALELGGKDAALVLEDADLERAARGIVWGAFQNAGQTCIGVERIFVVEDVLDSFLRELLEQVRGLKAGSTPGVDMGPMTTPGQLRIVEEHLADALNRGARVLRGGGRADPASNVFQPTVLVDVHPNSLIMTEETFGPLLPVVGVRDAEEAVRRANEVPYGLAASVWTGDRERGIQVARRLKAGGVCVNDVLVHYMIPGLPFGGVEGSGFGRTKGLEGLEEVTRTRSLVVDRLGRKTEPWWFPYNRRSERRTRAALAFRARGGLRGLAAAATVLMRRGRG